VRFVREGLRALQSEEQTGEVWKSGGIQDAVRAQCVSCLRPDADLAPSSTRKAVRVCDTMLRLTLISLIRRSRDGRGREGMMVLMNHLRKVIGESYGFAKATPKVTPARKPQAPEVVTPSNTTSGTVPHPSGRHPLDAGVRKSASSGANAQGSENEDQIARRRSRIKRSSGGGHSHILLRAANTCSEADEGSRSQETGASTGDDPKKTPSSRKRRDAAKQNSDGDAQTAAKRTKAAREAEPGEYLAQRISGAMAAERSPSSVPKAHHFSPESERTPPRHAELRKAADALLASRPADRVKRVKLYHDQAPSGFCHVCARHPPAVRLLPCANFAKHTCRKVVCDKCFSAFGWDFEEALANHENWECTHCRQICPERAQCKNYTRGNARRRLGLTHHRNQWKFVNVGGAFTVPVGVPQALASQGPEGYMPLLTDNPALSATLEQGGFPLGASMAVSASGTPLISLPRDASPGKDGSATLGPADEDAAHLRTEARASPKAARRPKESAQVPEPPEATCGSGVARSVGRKQEASASDAARSVGRQQEASASGSVAKESRSPPPVAKESHAPTFVAGYRDWGAHARQKSMYYF